MNKKSLCFLSVLALAAMFGGLLAICRQRIEAVDKPPSRALNASATARRITCFGIVEPRGAARELLPVSEGVIASMHAVENRAYRRGEVLYTLDTRQLEDEISVLQAQKLAAQAALDTLLEIPRPEDVAVAEMELQTQREELHRLELQKTRSESLLKHDAVSVASNEQADELWRIQKHRVALAEKQLAKLKAGPSRFEIAEARQQIEAVERQIKAVRTKINDAAVKAPFDGIVLWVSRREGEYVSLHNYSLAGSPEAPVTFGARERQVTVEIPEYSLAAAAAVKQGKAARKGVRDKSFKLDNPRLVPLVVPKKVLTGTVSEVVDVRIVKMVFDLEAAADFLPGEQVNVDLSVEPR